MTAWIFIGGVLLVGFISGVGVALLYVNALQRGDIDGQPGSD